MVSLFRLAVLALSLTATLALGADDAATGSADAAPAQTTNDAPKGDAPKGDAPKGDAPKGDAPKGDAPKGDAPKGEEPPPVVINQTIPAPDGTATYPACRESPVVLGKEDYQSSGMSLHDLPGVNINIDEVISSAKPKNIKLQADLKQEVVKRLNAAGMRLLDKEEMEKTPGQPEMNMYPSYPKHLGPFKPGEPRIEFNAACCSAGIWTSFLQGSSTLRDPILNYKLGTWGEGHNTTDCSDVGKWLGEVVLKTVDDFIVAKQKADQDYKAWKEKAPEQAAVPVAAKPAVVQPAPAVTQQPVVVQTVVTQPVEIRDIETAPLLTCDTAILLYAEIFPTASATISKAKSGILGKVAENMKACPTYRYRVETHSDQRSDTEYNDVLSARRAVAIRDFLVERGVNEEQFDLRFYGERKPLIDADTEEAWAANRRVVITPIKPKP